MSSKCVTIFVTAHSFQIMSHQFTLVWIRIKNTHLKSQKKIFTLLKISQNFSSIRILHSMVLYSLITFSHFFTLFMPHCGLTIFPNIELQRNCFVARVLLEHIINIESYFIAHKFDTTNSIRCFSPFLKVGG